MFGFPLPADGWVKRLRTKCSVFLYHLLSYVKRMRLSHSSGKEKPNTHFFSQRGKKHETECPKTMKWPYSCPIPLTGLMTIALYMAAPSKPFLAQCSESLDINPKCSVSFYLLLPLFPPIASPFLPQCSVALYQMFK